MKTIKTVESYPLCWPEGVRHAEARTYSRFDDKGKTIHRVRARLRDEVRRLGGKDLIISTNMRTRQDGEPVANAKEPDDPAAAVYFDLGGRTVCLACDRWSRLWENLYAIGMTIEAMRAVDRWGVSDLLERIFTGFLALTDDAGKGWAAVLGVSTDATESEIKAAYREKMNDSHPDHGGSDARAAEINMAYQAALREKNPVRLVYWSIPPKSIVCTTIETNRFLTEIMRNSP